MGVLETVRRGAVPLAGFAAGSLVGGTLFWAVGWTALHAPGTGIALSGLFFLSMLGFVGSMAAPLALVLYVRSAFERRLHRQLVTAAGYLALVAFVAGLGVVGELVLGDLGIDSPTDAIAFLDAAFGWTFGGIAGSRVASNWYRRRKGARSPSESG